MGFRRTTVALDEELYRQVKRRAVDLDRPIREIVQEALRLFCQGRVTAAPGRHRMPRFGAFRSRIKGSLSRSEIYRDRL